MPDQRFFTKADSLSIKELAELTGAHLHKDALADQIISDVCALDQAGSSDLSFLDNIKYKQDFINTKAGACFVVAELADLAPDNVNLLITPTPYKAYAIAAATFYPAAMPKECISKAAIIHKNAKLGAGCVIEAGAIINDGAEIGDKCWIQSHAIIGHNVVLGNNVRVGSHSTLSHCLIGNDVRFYPGVRIGQDGFGFAIDPAGHVKVPQLGRVIIGDHVEIGSNTCIDRGAGPDTEIGTGTWIDNLVQIAHNVKIGRGCVIVAQVGISGSSVLEDFVAVGGQAGIAGHLHIGAGAQVGAQAGLMRDVKPREVLLGTPAHPIKHELRRVAFLNRLIKTHKNS